MDSRGIAPGAIHIDWSALMAFRRSITDPIPEKREKSFADRGMTTCHGTARFTHRNTVMVGGNQLRGRHIVVALGAKPRPLGIPGEELVTTSDEFLELEALPRRVLLIGDGYMSFEFAHITAGVLLGSKALLEPAAAWRSSLGQTPAPEVASLLMRNLSTL